MRTLNLNSPAASTIELRTLFPSPSHAASSPDRGTERFLREACGRSAACAVLLGGARQEADTARWREWLQRSGLLQPTVLTEPEAALAWLEAP